MSLPPQPDWFSLSVDCRTGVIRLSFDQDTYVRLLARADVISLIIELARCLAVEPAPGVVLNAIEIQDD